MDNHTCITCGLGKEAKGSEVYICTICSGSYHALCKPSQCNCSDSPTLIVYPIKICLISNCQKQTSGDFFCYDCSERVHMKLCNIAKLYETTGIDASVFMQKACNIPLIPVWFSYMIEGSFFFNLYSTWITKTLKTIINVENVIYTIEYYILRGMLNSNYTMFDANNLTKLAELDTIKNQIQVTSESLLKTFRIFLRKITSLPDAPVLWLPNGKIRKKTPLNIFDKKSLLQQTLQRSTQGILICDIYAEYPEAHLHICELIKDESIWVGGNWDTIFPFTVALKQIPGLRADWLLHNK